MKNSRLILGDSGVPIGHGTPQAFFGYETLLAVLSPILLLILFFRASEWVVLGLYFQQEWTLVFVLSLLVYCMLAQSREGWVSRKAGTPRACAVVLLMGLGLWLLDAMTIRLMPLQAMAGVVATYGLWGFYVSGGTWVRSWPLVVMTCLCLPFQEQLQSLLGFPLRLLTTGWVSALMNLFGFIGQSEATVILTAEGATGIQAPCSGVKGLTAGALFFFYTIYAHHLQGGWRLITAGILYGFLLVLVNVWRVFSVVMVGTVFGNEQAATFLHAVLGILGFGIISLGLWNYLPKWVDKKQDTKIGPCNESIFSHTHVFIILIFAIGLSLLLYKKGEETFYQPKILSLKIPGVLLTKKEFSPLEKHFYWQRGVISAGKFSGWYQGRRFSLLVTTSSALMGHHSPDRCLRGMGLRTGEGTWWRIPRPGNSPLSLQKMEINEGKSNLFYWFTDGEKIEADLSGRVWQGIWNPRSTWALISLNIPGPVDSENQTFRHLFTHLQKSAESFLKFPQRSKS